MKRLANLFATTLGYMLIAAVAIGAPLSQFDPTTSAQLRSIITDATGTGPLVFGTSPTISGPTISSPTISAPTVTGTAALNGTTGLKAVTETYTAPAITSGTLTIDLSLGTVFNVASNANITTFTISNATASKAASFTINMTGNGTGYTQSWGSVKWPGGIAPGVTSTNGKVDKYVFDTNDGGTTWFGSIAGQNY